MASLAQLLAIHGSILVLDAASGSVQIGLLRKDQPAIWQHMAGDAGQQLFTGAELCLRQAGLSLSEVAAFVFCEGPGSMLGVRTAAMAIRTWTGLKPRPVYRFQSLALLAQGLDQQSALIPFSVIADARRDTWHCVTVNSRGIVQPLRRVPSTELAQDPTPLRIPSAFRAWAPPPRLGEDCTYHLPDLFARLLEADLFLATETPDSFQHESPEYKKWTAEVHQAPPR